MLGETGPGPHVVARRGGVADRGPPAVRRHQAGLQYFRLGPTHNPLPPSRRRALASTRGHYSLGSDNFTTQRDVPNTKSRV